MIAKGVAFLIFGVVVLLGISVIFARGYQGVMYDGLARGCPGEPCIEALNFAVQTITTVGYGNWVPDRLKDDASLSDKVLAIKHLSIWFMLISAPLFAFLIGLASALFLEVLR